jgi:hypothetical protein
MKFHFLGKSLHISSNIGVTRVNLCLLAKDNKAVGLVVMGIFVGVGLAIGLVVGLGLN